MANPGEMTDKELLYDQEISGDEGNSSAPDSVDSFVEEAYSVGMCAIMDMGEHFEAETDFKRRRRAASPSSAPSSDPAGSHCSSPCTPIPVRRGRRTLEYPDGDTTTPSDSRGPASRGSPGSRGGGRVRSSPGGRGRVRSSPGGRGRVRSRSGKRKAPVPVGVSEGRWSDLTEPDTEPKIPSFRPARTPGPQLDSRAEYTPLELFQLYFNWPTMETLCRNTNANAERRRAQGSKVRWVPVTVKELYRYLSVVLFMGLVKGAPVRVYWSTSRLYSFPFPRSVMSGNRFEAITWNLHMSDPAEDVENDRKKGRAGYDRLFRLKPLILQLTLACQAFYHPYQNISIDERMVASKARVSLKQYIKGKPIKWGFKLFVLADSRNGFTCDFSVYQGKDQQASGKGLSFDAVMNVLKTARLGTGYHLYVDNFYTSAPLFTRLHQLHYGACGTVRENRLGFLSAKDNAMPKGAERGDLRWIREGALLFVKWKDTREVTMCSTIHKAYSNQSVGRRVRDPDGTWTTRHIPIPHPVKAYNEHMGGVDLSDALIKYYSVSRKTLKWYKKLFLHFVDIAVVNSFILYKERAVARQEKLLTQRLYRELLCGQLADCGVQDAPPPQPAAEPAAEVKVEADRIAECGPVTIDDGADVGKSEKPRLERKYCRQCMTYKTIWACQRCLVPLCLVPDRNCYKMWHDEKKPCAKVERELLQHGAETEIKQTGEQGPL